MFPKLKEPVVFMKKHAENCRFLGGGSFIILLFFEDGSFISVPVLWFSESSGYKGKESPW